MLPETSFPELLERVRTGDSRAAEDLVRAYEPELRRAIRVRLTDARLRRVVDSVDICQSVLAGFFVRTAAGQFDIESPEQLLKLLVTMARNRVIDWARRAQADCRDGRRDVSLQHENCDTPLFSASEPGPATVLVNRELLERVRSRLSAEELKLVEQRSEGRDWNEIAAGLGEKPNAVRMKLSRALDRVANELGLEESHV